LFHKDSNAQQSTREKHIKIIHFSKKFKEWWVLGESNTVKTAFKVNLFLFVSGENRAETAEIKKLRVENS